MYVVRIAGNEAQWVICFVSYVFATNSKGKQKNFKEYQPLK